MFIFKYEYSKMSLINLKGNDILSWNRLFLILTIKNEIKINLSQLRKKSII
jgi:hypothetical protein